MPLEPPKDKSKRPPIPGQTPPKCRRCQSTQVQMMGRMDKSHETIFRCSQCGFVFTTT